jgi:hypothetical protein
MVSIEQRLVQDWKEEEKTDVEIFQAYEDIIQDGFVSLNLENIERELKRYNFFNNITPKKEVQGKIKEKIELITQGKIRKMEEDPSVKIIKPHDRKYWSFLGIKTFCYCGKPLRVKMVKIEKVIEREEGLVKENQYHQLLLYCPSCGNTYDSSKGLRNNGVTPCNIG